MKTAAILLDLAGLLGEVRRGTSTGGSTTTLVDASCTEPDKYFDGGTLWFLSGANIDKSVKVASYAASTTTFTFETQTALVAGVKYAAAPSVYSRDMLLAALNSALIDMGLVMQRDESLVGVADQEEYDLPTGVIASNVKRVEVNGDISYHWRALGGHLYFDAGYLPAADDEIVLWYAGQQASVSLDADVISDDINRIRLANAAGYYAVATRIGRAGKDHPGLAAQMKDFDTKRQEYAVTHRASIWPRDARLGGW